MTVKIDLRGTFGYGRPRVNYGPGKGVSVPIGLAKALGKYHPEEAEEPAAPAAAEKEPPPAPAGPYDGLSEAQVSALKEAGFKGRRSIQRATDEDLALVEGIGPAAIARLRANSPVE